MTFKDFFEREKSYSRLTLSGYYTKDQIVDIVEETISYCAAEDEKRLLIDISQVDGVEIPPIATRYMFLKRWAGAARGKVIVVLIAKPELIDGEKFGVVAAANMGLKGNVFTTETEAVEWLLGNNR